MPYKNLTDKTEKIFDREAVNRFGTKFLLRTKQKQQYSLYSGCEGGLQSYSTISTRLHDTYLDNKYANVLIRSRRV